MKLAALLFLASAVSANAAEITIQDGDSLLLDGKKVEIWGILSPSKMETCLTEKGDRWACGERALGQLTEIAADETFVCAPKEQGFVTCTAGGLDVGNLLVKEGLARARQDYQATEARAREEKVGIWE